MQEKGLEDCPTSDFGFLLNQYKLFNLSHLIN